MNKATKITLWIVGVAVFLTMLILGSIYDLQISKILTSLPKNSYYSANKLARVIDTVGKTVLYIMIDIALAIILLRFKYLSTTKKWLKILVIIGCIVASLGVTAYAIYEIVECLVIYTELKTFLYSTLGLFLLALSGVALLLGIYCIISLLNPTTIEKLFGWAIAILVVAVVSNAIALGLKYIVSRARYRAIIYEGLNPDKYFSPWYVINQNKFASTAVLYSDYFKSFPSGHCCAAASLFLFCLLPYFIESARDTLYYFLSTTLCIVYTMLVMLSRIIAGAHYFTDTLIGAGITIACILIYKAIFLRKKATKDSLVQTVQAEQTQE